jgi:hypothetical protein
VNDVSPRGEGYPGARCRIEERHIGSAWVGCLIVGKQEVIRSSRVTSE